MNNPTEDLALIREMMARNRRATQLWGNYFIAWGLCILTGLLGTWLVATGRIHLPTILIWGVCIGAGWLYTAWACYRERRRAPVLERAGVLVGTLWMAMGIAWSLMFFIGIPAGTLAPQAVGGIIGATTGAAMFVTGTLCGQSWLRNLAFGWWAGAVVMLAWPGVHNLLLMAGLIVGLYIVPGLVLNRQARAMQAGGAA